MWVSFEPIYLTYMLHSCVLLIEILRHVHSSSTIFVLSHKLLLATLKPSYTHTPSPIEIVPMLSCCPCSPWLFDTHAVYIARAHVDCALVTKPRYRATSEVGLTSRSFVSLAPDPARTTDTGYTDNSGALDP